ncbi:hypothetical protein EPUS_06473 [Endocarpon pusillum Z07020]|uniref:Fungal N-terminal domain-containing protein n=1 Tax=Endocarpon pusillum (strain Z07020 / HMAS-L-300199) TaxID=1263415 RepID=U1GXG9_ENDPU|nr:uncharacterized protein EPUS_06473 [Endocarpon pusillum Z07020]ERF77193.1 hypothetical protein EPUS_06473 [Endocarpon pusillum Z07020]
MEPVSIIGITASAFTLVGRLRKTLNFILQLSTKLKYANAKITLLIGYLASINAAIFEIAKIIETLSECTKYEKLVDSLHTTLKCTKLSLSFLESKIERLRSDSQDDTSMINKITMILKDAEFNNRSLLEQQGTLNSAEAQSIIEAMEDETSSIFCIADSGSITSQRSKGSEFSAALDISFQFDAEILSSRIYAVTYRSHLRQVIASKKHEDTTLIIVAQESPRVRGGHTNIDLLSLDRQADIKIKKLTLGTPREHQQEYPKQLPLVPTIKKITSGKINSNLILNRTARNPQSQEEPKKPYPKQSSPTPL